MPLRVPVSLRTIEQVAAPGSDVDLVPEGTIVIVGEPENRRIRIGETHSQRTDNPHNVTAAQVGALTSLNGIQNPGGGIELVGAGAVAVVPEPDVKRIVIESPPMIIRQQTFVGDGSTTLFSLTAGSYQPGNNAMNVYVDGVRQVAGVNYSESSPTSITFTEPPPAGSRIEAIWFESPAQLIQPGQLMESLQVRGSALLATDTGNVGIGTTGPTAKLHVVGDVRFTGTLLEGAVPWARLTSPPTVTISVGGALTGGGTVSLGSGGTINLSETHSTRTDNPHNTTAAQVGALVSIDGVSNPGGNVDLVAGANIAVTPDNAAKAITIALVQGAGSGLNADLLDGMQPSTAATANTIAQRDGSGYIAAAGTLLPDTNTRLTRGGGNALRVQTNSGYVDIGPQNTGYCHIYTDRAAFAFNKPIDLNAVATARLILPVGADKWAT